MISLLHETDYEMVGNREVRQDDWRRMREVGCFRFIVTGAVRSVQGRLALFLSVLVLSESRNWRGSVAEHPYWFAFVLYLVVVGLVHSSRVWHRLERRFHRD